MAMHCPRKCPSWRMTLGENVSEPFIRISAGAGGSEIPDGVWPVILSDIRGPKTVTAQRGPNAGQDIDLLDWVFAVDAPGTPLDGKQIEASTSTASGPRSKMFAYLTALLGGVAPAVGAAFEKPQLLGRRALATIQRDTDGWARIVNLGALPAQFQAAPAATPAPAAAPQQPVAIGAAKADDLPF